MSTEGIMGEQDLKNPREIFENDPMEEIFALNMGEFLTEHLISQELLEKISSSTSDEKKISGLKNQLKELISIYSLDKTLTLLGFNSEDDFIIYNSIAKTLSQMLEVFTCSIWLTPECLNNPNDRLILAGCSEDRLENSSSKLMDYVNDTFSSKKILYLKEGNKSILSVPMSGNAGDVGVIYIENENNEIPQSYIDLIKVTSKLFVTSMRFKDLIAETELILLDDFVTVMELRQLRAELTAIIGDLGDEQQMFVEAIATAANVKGQYEKEHSLKVAQIAKNICSHLKLNEKTSDLVYYAAMLQNIGKITLPEEVFSKKGELSSEDWKKLQNHPNIGVSLLMKINFLSEVIPYIHYHKERWDGKGQPEGLSGYSIPFGSRIIAAADAFQALISERPFRKALSTQEALDVMKKESGIKWDPAVVDALVEIV
ncbi:MAG: HD domain-containing protein [Candidatus Gastranaerophilales bacterium]|nr:HD domain-containing protein [Candidatus Gastranaerophilales bacterium]